MAVRRQKVRSALGQALSDARSAAGLTQVQVVERTALSQSQLSRIELGGALPTEEQAEELGQLYGLGSAQRADLVRQVRDAQAGVHDARLVIQRGSTLAMQQRWMRLEAESELVRAYQAQIVFGVLQTAGYAAVVMRQAPESGAVQQRMERHRRLLDGPRPRQTLILTEGALRFTVGSAAVMVEQVQAVIGASHRPHVRLGVIPASTPVQRVTTNSFHLYDFATVVVGVEVAAATLTAPPDVAHFEDLFGELENVALFGQQARDLLDRIAADHLRTSQSLRRSADTGGSEVLPG